jgi:hypothetical protein
MSKPQTPRPRLRDRLSSLEARRNPAFAWVAVFVFLSGMGLLLTGLMDHPHNFRWSVQYGWTGKVAERPLARDLLLGQALRTDRPVSQVGMMAATYQEHFPGRVEVLILKGTAPPKDRSEISRRRLAGEVRTGFDDGNLWFIDLGRAEYYWREGYYLLFRSLDETPGKAITFWLDNDPDWDNPQADLISLDGKTGAFSVRPAGGHLTLWAGYHSDPSLFKGLRMMVRGGLTTMATAWLGLWIFLYLSARATVFLQKISIKLVPEIRWKAPGNGGAAPLAENQKHLWFLFLLVLLLLLGLALKLSGLWHVLPLSFRATLGVALFMVTPGFLIFSLISLVQGHNYGFLTMLLLSCSLGMSSNFVANVIVFAFPADLGSVYGTYLIVICSLLAVLIGRLALSEKFRRSYPPANRPPGLIASLAFYAFLAALFITVVALHRYPGFYIEELTTLRSLAEAQTIRVGNLSILPGQITTYIFVPFYLFLALVARFCEVDVFRVVPAVWPAISLLSLLALIKITRLILGDFRPVLALVGLAGLVTLALPQAPSAELVLFLPTPDRYGISAGFFIPLAIFHFLLHLKHSRSNVATFIGLVYLITEMSFIHSRETLYFLAFVLIYSSLMAAHLRKLSILYRAGAVMGIVVLILYAYREVNLHLSPDLFAYVRSMGRTMLETLGNAFRTDGIRALVGSIDTDFPLFPYEMGRISRYQGYSFMGLMVGLLPLYALISRRTESLIMAAISASFGIFWMTDSLKLLIGGVVGSWFILEIHSFMALLLLVVFVDLTSQADLMVRLPGKARGGGLFHKSRWSHILLAVTLAPAAIGFNSALISSRNYVTMFKAGEFSLYLLTLAIVVYKVLFLPPGSPPRNPRSSHRIALGSLIFILSVVLLVGFFHHFSLRKSIGICGSSKIYEASPAGAGSDLPKEMVELFQGHRMVIFCYQHVPDKGEPITQELVGFIRSGGRHVWLGTDTLPAILSAPQYAPVISTRGRLIGDLIMNHEFEAEYLANLGEPDNSITLSGFWRSPKGREMLKRAVDHWKIDRLIAGPAEYLKVKRILRESPELLESYRQIFDDGRFLVFEVLT